METPERRLAEVLKLLANENRLRLLCELIQGPRAVGQLCEKMPEITQPALSQHLALLKAHGILRSAKSGQSVTYAIADHRVEAIIATLKRQYCDEGGNGS